MTVGKRKDGHFYPKNNHHGISGKDFKVGATVDADANIKGTDVKMILNTNDIEHQKPSLSVQVDSQRLVNETENYLKKHKGVGTVAEIAKGLNINGTDGRVLWASLINAKQFEIQTKGFTADDTTVRLK